jgi:hypothetical protein
MRFGQFPDELKGVAVRQVQVQQENVRLCVREGPAGGRHRAGLTATGQRGLLVEPMHQAAAEEEVVLHHHHANRVHRSAPANWPSCTLRRIRHEDELFSAAWVSGDVAESGCEIPLAGFDLAAILIVAESLSAG